MSAGAAAIKTGGISVRAKVSRAQICLLFFRQVSGGVVGGSTPP